MLLAFFPRPYLSSPLFILIFLSVIFLSAAMLLIPVLFLWHFVNAGGQARHLRYKSLGVEGSFNSTPCFVASPRFLLAVTQRLF